MRWTGKSWSEPSIDLPPGLPATVNLELVARSEEIADYHVWILERGAYIFLVGGKIKTQMGSSKADLGNPLGRILSVFNESKADDADTLGLRLDETLLRERPVIEARLSLLRILAMVAVSGVSKRWLISLVGAGAAASWILALILGVAALVRHGSATQFHLLPDLNWDTVSFWSASFDRLADFVEGHEE